MLDPIRVLSALFTAVALAVSGCTEPKESSPAPQPPPTNVPVAQPATPAADVPREDKPAKVDPVKTNGPIFVDWPKPKLAIVITGEQLGYLEPCGCAGLENQKGGLSRRYTLLKQLRGDGWPLLPIDLGGLIQRFGQQAEIKFQTAVEALKAMDYQAIGWGPEDLRLGAGILLSAAVEADGSPSRFVSANVGLFELNSGTTSNYRIVEAGGRKIGVTAVLGEQIKRDTNNADIKFVPPAQGLADVADKLKECNYRILLAYAPPQESVDLAKKFPQFNAVVTAGGADEPPREPRKVDGTETLLLEVGHKGMYAVVLGMYDDPKTPVRYQRVPIDHRFADSPEMKHLMTGYQDQLRSLGWSGLGLRPVVHPRASGSNDMAGHFVGSEKCGECHTKAMDIWTKTPHAHATETLAALDPPRQFDPECISCHATGWKPQEFVPYATGFEGLAETPHLKGNGCENCHGPGAAHVGAESDGGDGAKRQALREAMKISRAKAEESDCARCHDLDNSPQFNFTTYWPKVEHKGKD
jgi:cytochrome c554/c'-like protein